MNLSPKAKAIVAAVLTAAGAICVAFNVDPQIVAIATAILTTLGVYRVPNRPA
jgi:hypothetical protein